MILRGWLLFPNPLNGGLIRTIRGSELPAPASMTFPRFSGHGIKRLGALPVRG